jgi:hypothetical protein
VEQLKAANLEVEEFDFPKKKLSSIQDQIERLVAKNYELNVLAKDGFRLVSLTLSMHWMSANSWHKMLHERCRYSES